MVSKISANWPVRWDAKSKCWTPAVLSVEAAAPLLGISKNLSYRLLQAGQYPVPVIRVGQMTKVPTHALMKLIRPDVAA